MSSSIFHLIFLALSLLTLVGSSPLPATLSRRECKHDFFHIISCKPDPANTVTEGIGRDLFDRFRFMSQYAAAAYCLENNNSPHTLVKCQSGNCPLVEAANATTTWEFQNTPEADNTGYLAVDKTNGLIVAAIRGTESMTNWKTDLEMLLVPIPWCRGCRVHIGFFKAWIEIREVLLRDIQSATKQYPEYRVVVTGHSLGAAMATIIAGELRMTDRHLAEVVELYTFGSPRVGNSKFAAFLSAQSDKSYRITSHNDLIPRLPPVLLDYVHTSPEYWISGHVVPDADVSSPEDVYVVTGEFNEGGNSGIGLTKLSRASHGHYLGPITACYKDTGAERKREVRG